MSKQEMIFFMFFFQLIISFMVMMMFIFQITKMSMIVWDNNSINKEDQEECDTKQ